MCWELYLRHAREVKAVDGAREESVPRRAGEEHDARRPEMARLDKVTGPAPAEA